MASGVFKIFLFELILANKTLHSQASKDNKRATTEAKSSQSKALIDKQMPAAASLWVDSPRWL